MIERAIRLIDFAFIPFKLYLSIYCFWKIYNSSLDLICDFEIRIGWEVTHQVGYFEWGRPLSDLLDKLSHNGRKVGQNLNGSVIVIRTRP